MEFSTSVAVTDRSVAVTVSSVAVTDRSVAVTVSNAA